MKILHIDFTGTFNEDMAYQENLIIKYNALDGHVVTMLTTSYEWDEKGNIVYTSPVDKFISNGVRLIRLDYHKIINLYITRKIRKVDNVYHILEQINPDIIFFHGLQTFELLTIVSYLKNNPKIKLVIDNHADFSNSAPNFLSLWILHKIVWKYICKKAEPFVTKFYGVLPTRVDFLVNIYKVPRSKCELLVMGVDDEKLNRVKSNNVRNKIRIRFGFSESDFVIITGGKIDSAKVQTLLLLQAIRDIESKNIKLLIFGSITEALKDQILSFVDNRNFFYLGWLNTDDIYDYFAASDLAVFPGRHSVLWEQAVGMGIPCIFKYWHGTDHVDLGGNCEFLYDDSKSEIISKLKEIIYDKVKYQKMKKVAEELGIKKFSYKEISKHAIKI